MHSPSFSFFSLLFNKLMSAVLSTGTKGFPVLSFDMMVFSFGHSLLFLLLLDLATASTLLVLQLLES